VTDLPATPNRVGADLFRVNTFCSGLRSLSAFPLVETMNANLTPIAGEGACCSLPKNPTFDSAFCLDLPPFGLSCGPCYGHRDFAMGKSTRLEIAQCWQVCELASQTIASVFLHAENNDTSGRPFVVFILVFGNKQAPSVGVQVDSYWQPLELFS